MYRVYIHKNKINNKVYVGMTSKSVMDRWGGGVRGYNHNPYLVADVLKYGEDAFDHYTVKDNLTREEAQLLERQTIIELNATDEKYGYNCNCKGHSRKSTYEKVSKALTGKPLSKERIEKLKSRPVSEETRQKIREKLLGKVQSLETRLKRGASLKGHLVSEETRRKMSEAQLGEKNHMYGKHNSEEARRKISIANSNPSAEIRAKISAASKRNVTGRLFVNDGVNNRMIKPEQLDEFLSNGFVRGRILPHVHRSSTVSDATREKVSKNHKGRIRVTNGIDNKSIWPEQLDEYLSNGYYKGMTIKRKRKEE